MTFLHYAEHIVDIPGKRVSRFKVPIVENGQRVWRDMEEFDTSDAGAHPNWPARFFARVVDTYLAQTSNRGGRVGDAPCCLIDAAGLLAFALEIMTAVAADPRGGAAGREAEKNTGRVQSAERKMQNEVQTADFEVAFCALPFALYVQAAVFSSLPALGNFPASG